MKIQNKNNVVAYFVIILIKMKKGPKLNLLTTTETLLEAKV